MGLDMSAYAVARRGALEKIDDLTLYPSSQWGQAQHDSTFVLKTLAEMPPQEDEDPEAEDESGEDREELPSTEERELRYWRKHPNLHGWMQQLYAKKTGITDPGEFNCVHVGLTAQDIDDLEEALLGGEGLPETSGFFFGRSSLDDTPGDLEFVRDAKAALKAGELVYYSSWW